MGRALNGLRRFRDAWDVMQQSLALWRELGDQLGVANSLRDLGDIALIEGNDSQARSLYEEATEHSRERKDLNQSAYPIRRLGYYALSDGDPDQAEEYFVESLHINLQVKDRRGQMASIAGLAAVAASRKQWLRAAQHFGAVEPASLRWVRRCCPLTGGRPICISQRCVRISLRMTWPLRRTKAAACLTKPHSRSRIRPQISDVFTSAFCRTLLSRRLWFSHLHSPSFIVHQSFFCISTVSLIDLQPLVRR